MTFWNSVFPMSFDVSILALFLPHESRMNPLAACFYLSMTVKCQYPLLWLPVKVGNRNNPFSSFMFSEVLNRVFVLDQFDPSCEMKFKASAFAIKIFLSCM